MKGRRIFGVFVFLIIGCAPTAILAQEAKKTKIKLLWSYQTGASVYSSPSLTDIDNDGRLEVVVGSFDSKIYALNGEDGSLLWVWETGDEVFSSPSLGDIDNDGRLEVVVGSFDSKIYALNGENGSLLWVWKTGGDVYSSPSLGDIDNDGKLEVVVGSDDGKIYALNGENGSLLWSYHTGNWVYSSPSLGDIDNDGRLEVVVGSGDDKIYAINGEDGSLLWSYETGYNVSSSPSLGDIDNDGRLEVVVGSRDEKIYALNGEDGSLLWSYKTGGLVISSPSLGDIDSDGKLEVVVGSFDSKIYAINGEDGSLLWVWKTGDEVISSPSLGDIDSDGKLEVVVGSKDSKIYALNGEDGSLLWIYETGDSVYSSPSLGDIDNDGRLEVVVGSYDGKIYALSTGSPVPSPSLLPWTKFKRDIMNTGLFGRVKRVQKFPPFLSMKISYIRDESDDKILDGGERVDLGIEVSNKGKGDAYGVKAVFLFKQMEIEKKEEKDLGDIPAGGSKKVDFSLPIPFQTKTNPCKIFIDVFDSSKNKAEKGELNLRCAEVPPPNFSLYSLIDDDLVGASSGNSNGSVEKGETVELRLNLRNEGNGNARDVEVHLSSPDEIEIIENTSKMGNIPSGAEGNGVVVFSVPGDFRKKTITLDLKVKERTGLFSTSVRKTYPVGERKVEVEIAGTGTVPTQPSLAIWGIATGKKVPENVNAEVLWDHLIGCAIRTGRFNVLTKENVWTTLADSGVKVDEEWWKKCTDAVCLVDFGRLLQAEYIIGSKLDLFQDTFIFTASIYDVQRSKVINTKTKDTKGRDYESLKSLIISTCEELFGMR